MSDVFVVDGNVFVEGSTHPFHVRPNNPALVNLSAVQALERGRLNPGETVAYTASGETFIIRMSLSEIHRLLERYGRRQ